MLEDVKNVYVDPELVRDVVNVEEPHVLVILVEFIEAITL